MTIIILINFQYPVLIPISTKTIKVMIGLGDIPLSQLLIKGARVMMLNNTKAKNGTLAKITHADNNLIKVKYSTNKLISWLVTKHTWTKYRFIKGDI